MGQLNSNNKTLKKNNIRDTNIVVLADGYGGDYNFAKVDEDGYQYTHVKKGVIVHYNGIVGTTPITITPTNETISILIHSPVFNTNADMLKVSFDGGINYFDITRAGSLGIETEVTSFLIQGTSSTVNYQILVTYKNPSSIY